MLISDEIKRNQFKELLKNTREYNIEKILNYIKQNGGMKSEYNDILFQQYYEEKSHNIALEQIIARTILILANEGMIYLVLSRHFSFDEDYYSVGKLGLIKAVDCYDINKGAFSTFANKIIFNNILVFKRNANTKVEKRYTISSLDTYVNENNVKDHAKEGMYDTIADPYDFRVEVAEQDFCKYIKKSLFKHLTPVEQKVLIYKAGLQGDSMLNQPEIAEIMGVSQSYISRVERRAIKKMLILLEGDKSSEVYKQLVSHTYDLCELEDLNEVRLLV